MPVDITEYQHLAMDSRGNVVPTGREPGSRVLQVAVGGGSVQSAAFLENTRIVRVHTDVPCRIAFGENPTASAASQRQAANSTEYYGVSGGHKIAVITST